MYVRTWKDTEMVATSDSNPTGSASNDEPGTAAASANPSTTGESQGGPESTSPPDVDAPPSEPAAAAVTPSPTESTRSADTQRPESDSPKRTRSRRSRPAISGDQVLAAVNGVRERLAALVWIVTVVFAVILAAGALLIALDANPNNDLVEQVIGWAQDLDGPFRDLFTFDGDNAATKRALVNWGLAAAAWLVGGKIVSAIIRP